MAEEFESVDVWVGRFPSQEALDAYLEETYSGEEEDDETPISRFASDQGETFYDSDFQETNFLESEGSLDDLLQDLSFVESYRGKVKEAYGAGPIANTVILFFGQQFENPKSVSGEGYELIYLGQFDCVPS